MPQKLVTKSQLNGTAVAAIALGSMFTWSGIKGWSLLGVIGDVITGVPPQMHGGYQALTAPGGGSPIVGDASGLAALAHQGLGHCYVFGGAPGTDGKKCWDCSSFVNYLVSVKLHMAIPGYGPGKYDGSTHGPPTLAWAAWPGLKRIKRADVQAGDIIVWSGHMGIAISNKQMISAQDPQDKTKIGPIDGGGNGPLLKYGRLG